jgi:hypothetical protein
VGFRLGLQREINPGESISSVKYLVPSYGVGPSSPRSTDRYLPSGSYVAACYLNTDSLSSEVDELPFEIKAPIAEELKARVMLARADHAYCMGRSGNSLGIYDSLINLFPSSVYRPVAYAHAVSMLRVVLGDEMKPRGLELAMKFVSEYPNSYYSFEAFKTILTSYQPGKQDELRGKTLDMIRKMYPRSTAAKYCEEVLKRDARRRNERR